MPNTDRLRDFVAAFTRLVEGSPSEAEILAEGRPLLAGLVAVDDWLPDDYARPSPERYQQYLLHCDPLERFSVVSFVWGPGQQTPIHDHTVWGLIGVLRGVEIGRRYVRGTDDSLVAGPPERMERGTIEAVSPRLGDVHRVANGLDDAASVSIHVYGANIGAVRRSTYDPATGAAKTFISGYSNTVVPNLWDRSRALVAA